MNNQNSIDNNLHAVLIQCVDDSAGYFSAEYLVTGHL